MQIFINAWSELWCITSPGISFDFGSEVVSTGQPEDRGFYFANGEKQYMTSWDTREPWRFIPYGQLAINVLRQHFRISEAWKVTFHHIGASTDQRSAHEFPRNLENASLQPEYESAMYHTVPGSMITYDWGVDRILAPILLKKNMANNNWHLLETTPVVANSPDAGFLLDSPAIAHEMQHSAPNFLRTFGKHRKAATAVATPAASTPKSGTTTSTDPALTEVKPAGTSPPVPTDKTGELTIKEN